MTKYNGRSGRQRDDQISDIIDRFEPSNETKAYSRSQAPGNDWIGGIESQLNDQFRIEYEKAEKEGKRRFGTRCKHHVVKNGGCQQCLRKTE